MESFLIIYYLLVCVNTLVFSRESFVATCEPITNENRHCLGQFLPYRHTSTKLAEDSNNQKDIQNNLKLWEGLRFLPKCWSVLQPLLCQIYVPKCENSTISPPCREQCLATRKPCSVVERYRKWPDFLNCERFPRRGCNGTIRLKLNGSVCRPPLVETRHKASWYEGIEGCGIQCRNPIFSQEEHTRIHRFVAAFGALTTLCTMFTIITFLIDWKSQCRYPSVILFYMNSCFCLASIGFLIQFGEGARDRVVCRNDDTMRLGEPSEPDCFVCMLTFVLVYYFSMAGVIWFVMLAYSWCISFKTLGSTRDNFVGKKLYFHAVSWSLPAVLTVCALVFKKVDANSISGICFVGYEDVNMRALFLLAPLGLNLLIGGFYLVKGLVALFRLRKSNPSLLSSRQSTKIKETILRVGIFAFVAFAFGFITFACHLYEFSNLKMWEKSYRDYLYCIADTEVKGILNKCTVSERPNLSVIELGLSSLFGVGVAMSSWKWTSNTFRTWKKFWKRITKAQRYPELSHYRLIRRMRANRVGPSGQAAVVFNQEPRLTAIKSAEENWRRRRNRKAAAVSLQLESVYSEQQSHNKSDEHNKEITSSLATKTNTMEQKPRTFDSSSSLYNVTST